MPDAFMFVAGGAVQAGGGVYLERNADRELLRHCLAGDFTYILTSRQLGKSSLMYRAAERLVEEGVCPVIIDLTELGAQTTADQWYKGFLLLVQEQLGLRENASGWWDAHESYAYAHRLIRYLREVALAERSERLVLFVDEIDTTLRLDFTDDFFAAIRFLYQHRAVDPALQRVSFVLIGVATPNDLIKDAARTPFNIGVQIELTDFTPEEAVALADHLAVPPAAAGDLIARILHWTSGHPYLTLRVLRSLAETPPAPWTEKEIDVRIGELFFGPGGESDTNLQFVRDMLTKKAFNREAVLAAYEEVRSGARVPDQELDQVASWLKLSGIVRREAGLLRVRNAIYDRVFDQRWARVHRRLHVNWRRRLTRAAAALLVLTVAVTIPLAVYALRQQAAAEAERDESARQRDDASRQRDEAAKQRDEAARQLLAAQESLRTAQEAVAVVERFDPKAAAQLTTDLATLRATADQKLAQLTEEREQLRRDRDEARSAVQRLTQENAALKQGEPRAAAAAATTTVTPTPTPAAVAVPDVRDQSVDEAERTLRAAGFRPDVDTVASDRPRGTIVRQSPLPGVMVGRGSAVLVSASLGAPATPRSVPDETQQVIQVLQRYQAAYQALDIKALTSIYPTADVKNLQAAFNDLEGLRYELRVPVDGIKFGADGQTASITVFVTSLPNFKVGTTRKDTVTTTSLFTMRKASGVWIIQNISRN